MIKKIILSSLLFYLICSCYGQAEKRSWWPKWEDGLRCGSFYTGYGELFTNTPKIDMSLSFPYASTASPNVTYNFYSTISNLTPQNYRNVDGFNISFFRYYFFLSAGFGFLGQKEHARMTTIGGIQAYGGGGFAIPFDFKGGLSTDEKRFVLLASFNGGGSQFDIDIGAIKNYATTINAPGATSVSTFTYSTGGKNPQTKSGTTDELKVGLTNNVTYLFPKISFILNPMRYGLYFGFSVSYYSQCKALWSLFYEQKDNAADKEKNIGGTDLNDKNVTLIVNGHHATSLPTDLSGFSFNINLGFSVSHDRLVKKSKSRVRGNRQTYGVNGV